MLKRLFVLLIISAVLLWNREISGKVYLTRDDALKKAFPETLSIDRHNLFLEDRDISEIESRSGAKVESKLFTYYRAIGSKGVVGYAVIESHVVRTKPGVYMAVIRPNGEIESVEILAFYEPEEYLPPARWLAQFTGKRLNERLWIKRDIQGITGATFSAYGLTREVRKVLAIFEIKILQVRK